MQVLHSPQTRAALLIAIAGIAIFYLLAPYMVGLLSAAVLYVVCEPVYARLLRWLRSKHLSAAITLLLALILIVLPLVAIVGMLVDQAPQAIRAVQDAALLDRLATWRIGTINVGAEVAKAGGTVATWLSRQAVSILGGAASVTLTLMIAFFGLYYLLLSGTDTWPRFRAYLPFSPESADELRDRFFSMTHATLLGTFLIALLQGLIIGSTVAVIGLPAPMVWGVMAGFASILPVIGTGLVWIPAVIVLLVQQRFGAAIALTIICSVVAGNIDNVIRPMIYKRVSDIHPMITLVGAFAGVKYFGLLGVLLGPLAIVYFLELVRLYKKDYIDPDPASQAPLPMPPEPDAPPPETAPTFSPAAAD
ncbi:MAG TPA: AI-2E family transporter [Gemmatimonadaceae bacterium]|nr:AI-2E family transporter [Gemmatimonadaceae bacterium]